MRATARGFPASRGPLSWTWTINIISLMVLIVSSWSCEKAGPGRTMCPDGELSPRNRHPRGERRQLVLRSPRTFNLASEIGQGPFQGVLSRTDRFARGLECGLLREDDAGQAMPSQLVFDDGPKQMSFHRVGANVRTADDGRVDQAARNDPGPTWDPLVRAAIRDELPERLSRDMTDSLQPLLDSIFIQLQLALRLVHGVERLPRLRNRRIAQVDVASMEDGRRRYGTRNDCGGSPPGLDAESQRHVRHRGRINGRRKKMRDEQGLSGSTESPLG